MVPWVPSTHGRMVPRSHGSVVPWVQGPKVPWAHGHFEITQKNVSCLVSSCLLLSCLALSSLVLSRLVFACLLLSGIVLSCPHLSCLVLPGRVVFCPVLSRLVLHSQRTSQFLQRLGNYLFVLIFICVLYALWLKGLTPTVVVGRLPQSRCYSAVAAY